MTLRLMVFTAEATAMTGDVPPSDRTQPTVRLDVAHATPIDLVRAIDAFTDLGWLGPQVAGSAARTDLRRVRTDLELPILDGSGAGSGPIRKAALLDVGMPLEVDGSVLVEIGWQSATLAPLFPVFAGSLRVATSGLELEGYYVPPFGRVGLLIDDGVLGLIARRTAQALLARLAVRLGD